MVVVGLFVHFADVLHANIICADKIQYVFMDDHPVSKCEKGKETLFLQTFF